MMNDSVTKDDLRQFGLLLLNDIRKMIDESQTSEKESLDPEWLKSRVVRKLMDMSAGSLQNLRVTGKVRFKKVLGSYYYNKTDLKKLFGEE
ncbi:DNA-binding protein [Flavobacterium humidisoli]|jgi:hypothetical protein|uniref:DNA-binding protein n=1 Tax=Flavobacterium humidisoli TaxID=2937442 RepID=A0ABY4LUC5_9FLAO|nr:DNA-binding protein [Flavobacterium humidisoli]UPZ16188.1 DNA-binding protein [Flavobacterium humidisoli]